MPSQQILPLTHKPAYPCYESPPSSTLLSISALTDTMLPKGNDPTTRLLISASFDDEKTAPRQPLLPRVSSYSSIRSTISNQKRHRRTASGSSLSSQDDDASHQSLSREVGHAAAETFLVTRLSLKLLKYLG